MAYAGFVWWLIGVVASAASAQTYEVTASKVRQGQTIRLVSKVGAVAARMNDRKISLFRQRDGSRLGVMPVPLEETPGEKKIDFLSESGAIIHTTVVRVQDGNFPEQDIQVSQATKSIRPSRGEMATVGALRKTVSARKYWTEPFVKPVPGCMNSPFGVKRLHNGVPTGNYHRGVDQRSPARWPVRATARGKVRIARRFNLHGGTVGIDHGQGVTSIYIHLSRIAVKRGAIVNRGQVIGYVGATGFATGPHLHWGINVNGVTVDPTQWVPLEECNGR